MNAQRKAGCTPFSHWFENHYIHYIPLFRPVLLLMDGHSSHFCPNIIRMAAKEKIILFTLPPNTTHLTQPLYKGCFGPLKVACHQVCHRFYSQNPGRVVSIYDFSALFSEAWSQSMTVKNITSGFKVTGIYPVGRCAVQVPGQKPSFKPDNGRKIKFGLCSIIQPSSFLFQPKNKSNHI